MTIGEIVLHAMTVLSRLTEIAGASSLGLFHFATFLDVEILEYSTQPRVSFERALATIGPGLAGIIDASGSVAFSVLVIGSIQSAALTESERVALARLVDVAVARHPRGMLARGLVARDEWLVGAELAICSARSGSDREFLIRGRTGRPPGWVDGSIGQIGAPAAAPDAYVSVITTPATS